MSISRVFFLIIGIALMIFGLIGFTNARYVSEAGTIVGESFAATPGTPIPNATETSVSVPTSEDAPATSVAELTASPTLSPTVGGETGDATTDDGNDVPTQTPPLTVYPPGFFYSYQYSFNFSAIDTHIVQPGETLFCIGRAYYVNPWAIGFMNGIQMDDHLFVGQLLSVPNAPWTDIIPGKVCLPQFASPYVPTPTPVVPTPTSTPTATTVSDANQSENGEQSKEPISPQLVITETRKILVSLPKNMILGESLELTLTFNPEDLDAASGGVSAPIASTPLPTPDSERQVSPPSFSDVRHYEDYLLYAIARLDAPGFTFSSANEERRLVQVGEEIVYRWSIQPVEAENQTVIVSLWLEYEPMRVNMAPVVDGMYWNASYKVEVRQTFLGLTTRSLQTTSFLAEGLGLVSVVIGLFPSRKKEDEGG